jgi:hypothetical protein
MRLIKLSVSVIVVVFAAFVLRTVTEPASPAVVYSVTDLGELNESEGDIVRGLNILDEVVGGASRSGSGTRAFIRKNTKVENVEALSGSDRSISHYINEQSSVAGSSNTVTSLRAFVWTRKGGVRNLGTLPGDSGSQAFGINKHNELVGYSSGPDGIEAVLARWLGVQEIRIEARRFSGRLRTGW